MLFEPLGQLHVEDRRGRQQDGSTFGWSFIEFVTNLIRSYISALYIIVIHLINEKRIGHPRHLIGRIRQKVAEQQQQAETHQQQVDQAKAPIGAVVILADSHATVPLVVSPT